MLQCAPLGPAQGRELLTPADNLEAILVVDTDVTMSCQSTGTDKLVSGQWVVDNDPMIHGDVYNYGEVLRRQSRPSFLGWELPTFLRVHRQSRIVLPPMSDVLLMATDQLGSRIGSYGIVLDIKRRNPTEHVFSVDFSVDLGADIIFTGSTPPMPTFWLPEFLTNPIFIAPMAADVQKEVVIKGYRLWGHLEPLVSGICNKGKEIHSSPSAHYRALFLLYGRGNSIRDKDNNMDIAPVCQEPANKVSTGGRRARFSSKLAFLPRHKTRTTL
ncbi:MAG: hypothetical protein M1826_003850 [Phylliscum demangeonii]|nr:MAG: hypothetical protein M1826_003850 [Phylliscum demangeonii]